MSNNLKVEVARRQLGTALALFLDDQDPVSVHCLACGGGEIADALAREAGLKPFSQYALEINSDISAHELQKLINKYWNAMKHSTRNGKFREDQDLLSKFNDEHNDHVLFIGWYDYACAVGVLPIEAQAFQIWYFANFPDKLAPEFPASEFERMFPGIRTMKRSDKKKALRHKISFSKSMKEVMRDQKTDRRKLILSRQTAIELT